jgi:hypothetical protein
MDRRDAELLAKQMRGADEPSPTAMLVGLVVAVFLIGMLMGGMVFAPPPQHHVSAPHDALAALATTHNGALILR